MKNNQYSKSICILCACFLGLSIGSPFLALAQKIENESAPTLLEQAKLLEQATLLEQAALLENNVARDAPPQRQLILKSEIRSEVNTAANKENSTISTIIEIPASADSYMASERPNENFGGDSLFLGYNFFGDRYGAQRIIMRFNLDSIPSNARINDARLRLRLSSASPVDDPSMRTVVRRLNSEWDEYSVTWNREPEWASVRDSTFIGTAQRYYEWEIPDLVQGWVDESFANYGIEIIGDENIKQSERVFYARETTTGFPPRLFVDYIVINDTSPPDIKIDPLPSYVGRNFIVRWSATDLDDANVSYYDLQYRVDGEEWIDWLSGVTTRAEEFTEGQNGRIYQFRARGVDDVGNVEPFGDSEAITTVDSRPPVSRIAPLPRIIQEDNFLVSWAGSDEAGSGIQYYEVQYRVNDEPWQIWQSQTIETSATFIAPTDNVYAFEVRAVDKTGRVEPFTDVPEETTVVDAQAPFITPKIKFPLIFMSP